ncbi:MAG: hypothetical protein P8046_04905 [Anaerolineales bacterium]
MRSLIEKNIPRAIFILVSTITLVYIIGYIQIVPYAGFQFDGVTGEVLLIFDKTQPQRLQIGDQIQKIGDLSLSAYQNDLRATFWDGAKPGDVVPVEIIRDGKSLVVPWRFTGYNTPEFNDRFYTPWIIAIVFLFSGIVSYNFIRPKNTLWALLIIYNFATAILIAAMSGASHSHLFYAAHMVHLTAWVLALVLIHLHWLFPIPFNSKLNWVEKYIIPGIYLVCIPLLVIDLQTPSKYLYVYALLISLLVSFFLLIFHTILQKQSRQQVWLILRFNFVATLPLLILIILDMVNIHFNIRISNWVLIAFPLVPIGYMVAIWQGQVGEAQFRSNRILALSIYLVTLFPITIALVNLLSSEQNTLSTPIAALLIIVFAVVSVMSFNSFQKLVERVLLRIPVPITDLVNHYSKNLADTETPQGISSSMKSLVLPTLLVRQSALLEFQFKPIANVLDSYGIEISQIPQGDTLKKLVDHGNPIPSNELIKQLPKEYQWIRVVMPLTFDQELIGVWLLGARDPDDVYHPEILSSLESIAQQTTFAIINHQKTARLRALYQANIHRNEQERASLSRDLHDETLNQIALLQREYSDPQLGESLNQITASLREVIQGLRPEMLSFGLINALEDMADSLNERSTTPPITVNLDGPALPLKGLQEIELHIFRIVQQACENAIHHASASAITIQGTVNAGLIDILVSDDGAGIEDASSLNLTVLINQQNYGLASMYERADLIKAAINITSRLGEGTQVQIIWPASSKDNSTSSP